MANSQQTYDFDPNQLQTDRRIIGPAVKAGAITPGTIYGASVISRAIYVGGSGNVNLKLLDGSNVTFVSVDSGTLLPVASILVNTSGTTATNMVWVS